MDLRAEFELHEHLTSLAGPLRWYIARTQGGQDETAKQALCMRGYTVYRPLMPGHRGGIRGLRNEWRSMFPGYLFVLPANHTRRTDIGPWEMLRTAPGMIYGDRALMKSNGAFAGILHNDPIHGGIVQIREAEERLCIIKENGNAGPSYKVGDQVRVKKGPFIEFLGIIETLDDNKRADIISDIFGRPTRLRGVRVDHLSPA